MKARLIFLCAWYAKASPVLRSVLFMAFASISTAVMADDTVGEAPARAVVGAIRWDAWHGDASTVGLTVEKTLSPTRWHYRLPFYGKVVGENAVEVRGNTREIMDREIDYAHAAGLDYWAFVIYPEDNALSQGLHLYLASEKKSHIKFCMNLQGGWEASGGSTVWPGKIARYIRYFKEPFYQTVLNGRPLVYLYSVEGLVGPGKFEDWAAARTAFDALRAAVIAAGMPTPYIVAQGWSVVTLKDQMETLGLDAIGAYASSAGAKAGAYADLARHTEEWWNTFKSVGKPIVPLVTTGWDMRPRVETPVPWVKGGDIEQYYEAPNPQELATHLEHAIAWCREHPETAEARAILIYAWNEFDEGGWLCPTLAEGSTRLDALGGILNASVTTGAS